MRSLRGVAGERNIRNSVLLTFNERRFSHNHSKSRLFLIMGKYMQVQGVEFGIAYRFSDISTSIATPRGQF